ncbi:MAG: hypothetical protein KC684_09525, partial [Candidatus Omnitrophica bacterium]|nr:hypothetical protein [Candidatus Omnitrophota bacterium]
GVEVEVSAAVDFYNQYIWRGFKLDSDPVIQPSVTISAAGFEGGFWGSFDVDQDDGEGVNSDEVDGWIGYGFDLGFIDEALEIVSLSVGNTWYSFPGTDLYTKELYVGLSVDTLLSPYFTWYHDYGDEDQGGADGNYYMFGIGHSLTLSEDYGITLDAGFELGLNDDAFITGNGGYTLTTLGLTIPLSDNVTMAPVIAYSSPFKDLSEDSGGFEQDDEFYTGVSMSFSM